MNAMIMNVPTDSATNPRRFPPEADADENVILFFKVTSAKHKDYGWGLPHNTLHNEHDRRHAPEQDRRVRSGATQLTVGGAALPALR